MLLFDKTVLENLLGDVRDWSENFRHHVVWRHDVLASLAYEVLEGKGAFVVGGDVFVTTITAPPYAVSKLDIASQSSDHGILVLLDQVILGWRFGGYDRVQVGL